MSWKKLLAYATGSVDEVNRHRAMARASHLSDFLGRKLCIAVELPEFRWLQHLETLTKSNVVWNECDLSVSLPSCSGEDR